MCFMNNNLFMFPRNMTWVALKCWLSFCCVWLHFTHKTRALFQVMPMHKAKWPRDSHTHTHTLSIRNLKAYLNCTCVCVCVLFRPEDLSAGWMRFSLKHAHTSPEALYESLTHQTNEISSIKRISSSGCISMRNTIKVLLHCVLIRVP